MDTISDGGLIICAIRNTFRSTMKRFQRPYRVDNRHSDAFVVVLSGECDYTFDCGASFTATKGSVIYLSKGDSYFMNVRCELYDVFFTDFDFLDEARRPSELFPYPSGNVEGIIRSLHEHKTEGTAAARLSLLYALYSAVCTSSFEDRAGISSAAERIEREFSSPDLSVSSLAEEFGISEVYFRRLFEVAFGTPPSKYIRSVRIAHAKELLRFSQSTVSECAEKCGFSSLQYFCRAFRESTGMTPNEYRKKKFRGT